MQTRKLSAAQIAKQLDISGGLLSLLRSGKRPITSQVAKAIQKLIAETRAKPEGVDLIQAYEDSLTRSNKSKKSIGNAHRALTVFRAWLATQDKLILQLKRMDLNAALTYGREHYMGHDTDDEEAGSQAYLKYHKVLVTLFHWIRDNAAPDGWSNPMQNMKPPKVQKHIVQHFSEADLEAIRAAVMETANPVRNRAFIETLLDGGARLQEWIGITRSGITREADGAGFVRVKGKGNRLEQVHLSPLGMGYLQQFLATHNQESVWAGWKYDSAKAMFAALQKALGSKVHARLSAHTFRHTCAVLMHQHGASLQVIKNQLRHASLAITEVYMASLGATETAAEHTKFSPLGGQAAEPESELAKLIRQIQALTPTERAVLKETLFGGGNIN